MFGKKNNRIVVETKDDDNKKYKYLIGYGFVNRIEDNGHIYHPTGTGRTIADLHFELETFDDILCAEKQLKNTVGVENIEQFTIYSFSRLKS